MSFTQQAFTISADKILIDNKDDRFSNHCELATPGNVSENDLHIKDCHLKLVDGALQTDQIQSRDGTTMIDFDGGNSSIDFNGRTLNNVNLGTITLNDLSVSTSAVASDNYPGYNIDHEMEQLQANINTKVNTTGHPVSKFLTTSAAGGTIQFSKNISDVVDLTTAQDLENKTLIAPTIKIDSSTALTLPSSAGTLALTSDITADVTLAGNNNFTGNNTFTNADLTSGSEIKAQGDLIIDTTEDGRLRYERSQVSPLTGTVKTFLDITDHQNTGVGPFTLILPSIRSGATQDVLVGRETTDTLLNKTMDYNSNTFQNFPTAEVSLNGSETLTNKTMDYNSNTFQNFPTGDVTLNGSETLTNKTMDYNSNTFQNFPTGLQASDNINFSGNCTFSNPTHFGTTSSDGTVSVLYSNSSNYALNVMNGKSNLPQARFFNGTRGVDIHTGNSNSDDFALSARGYNGIGFNVMNDGKVGIDTTSPYCSLQIGALGAGHASTGGGYNSTRFNRLAFPSHHHDNNRFIFSNMDPNSSTAMLELHYVHNTSAHNNDIMSFNGNGKVGFNTTSVETYEQVSIAGKCLRIHGFYNTANTGPVGELYSGGARTRSGHSVDISILSDKAIYGITSVYAASDSRIKKEIEEVPDNDALRKLNEIDVKYYKYKDHRSRGDQKQIGFIAQQVQDVFPIAVALKTEFVPNVYVLCENFTFSPDEDKFRFVCDEIPEQEGRYKFICSDTGGDGEHELRIQRNDDGSFTFEKEWDNVFCFGYEIDDMHILDKQKLFALNFSATQELSRQLDAAKQEIAALKQQVQTLFSLYQAS